MKSITMNSAKGLLGLAVLSVGATAVADQPQYTIVDLGVVNSTDSASQGFRISASGIATGRSFGTGKTQAYTWTQGGGLSGLSNLASPVRNYCVGNGVNDSGTVVGVGATTSFGSSRLPVMWENGVATQLGLPSGQTLGDANDVNNNKVAVGSANSGTNQRAVIYQSGTGSFITATTSNGSYFVTAFGVNDSGLVVGEGWDPNNAAVTVGLVYDMSTGTTSSLGSLTSFGHNSAIAFDVSNAGYVVGSSSLNGGANSLPFVWTAGGGMSAIALPTGTSQGSARGVNDSGWVVGTASSAFAIPFLYDGTNTYRLADLLVNSNGWDLLTNTSSSAMGISDSGVIVGTGVHNGATHAYAMVPVPEPASFAVIGLGALALISRKRKNQ